MCSGNGTQEFVMQKTLWYDTLFIGGMVVSRSCTLSGWVQGVQKWININHEDTSISQQVEDVWALHK
jgi:hypothetical protein